jgi:hypothetical protein
MLLQMQWVRAHVTMCQGGEGSSCAGEARCENVAPHWRGNGGKGRAPYRGEDTTKDEKVTMDMHIVVFRKVNRPAE